MKQIRTLIYKLFGLRTYLMIVSYIYLFLVKKGFLKNKYPELFYLKKLIKPGFKCIDIGANLGYYSCFLSNLCKKEGKVYAVEPVPLFAEIWGKNINNLRYKNTELLNYALGGENKKVKMGMPKVGGVIHHGMTKIASSNNSFEEYFEVEMKIPDELFAFIENLDFVKCDVEGYESEVFENMKNIIRKFKPIVQSELGGMVNRKKVIEIFKNAEYNTMILLNGKLNHASEEIILKHTSDFYFIPK